MAYARIVPPTTEDGSPCKVQGTQVWVGDQQLKGVTGLQLICRTNDVWRAVIECVAIPPEIDGVVYSTWPDMTPDFPAGWDERDAKGV